jgi:hypothetical protein
MNCFIEQLPQDAKTPSVLIRAPGLSSWASVGDGPIQGMHADHGLLYVVSGGVLYSVTSGAVATSRGTVGSSSEIDIDSNEDTVVVVSPPNAYYWDGSTFAQITDTDFTSRGAGDVEFCDDFMLFREPETGRFFGADAGSVTAFDALNFATAEGGTDTLVGMKVDHRQVVLFGERTIELWQNTGASGFPFERMINGFVEIGCLNGRSVAKVDNSLVWVADDYTVRRLDGLTPARISTHAVEQWLRTVTVTSLRGGAYSLEGHVCYVLTADEGCFVYDVTTQLWHERATYDESTWNWANPVRFAGKVLVGSTVDGTLAELDPETYDELSDTLRMEWDYQPAYAEGARAFHDRLELVIETGVGLTSGQGSAPVVMLSYSDDGGVTFRILPNKALGALGNRKTRVAWSALGSCGSPHGRIYRAAVSDPVKVAVTDTILSVRGGRL